MPKRLDLTGQVFGRLTVIAFADVTVNRSVRWHCRCECGGMTISQTGNLRSGIAKSCGCLKREITAKTKFLHGRNQKDPTYGTWYSMRQRCSNPNHQKYPQYGARGIKVCARWEVFLDFLSDMGERPAGMTIDRINVNGDYEPGNCRWATAQDQRNNTTATKRYEYNGSMFTMRELATMSGQPIKLIQKRILVHQWSIERALSTPKSTKRKAA